LNGYVPSTVEEYLDASSQDGVWVQGIHWLRAISCFFYVRVAVIIYGQPIVRFFGSGPITIFLYKVRFHLTMSTAYLTNIHPG
jgi:hypothetical protein